MHTTPVSLYGESRPPRNPHYRLTNPGRWGSLTFTDLPMGSAEWYERRAHRIARFATILQTPRARDRAHRTLLMLSESLRDEHAREASATVLAIARQLRTRWHLAAAGNRP